MDIPVKRVSVAGRAVEVRPFRFFDLPAVTRLYDQLQSVDGDVARQTDVMAQIFALALRVGRDDFEQIYGGMEVAEAMALMDAVAEVNQDFFSRRASPATGDGSKRRKS